jgi:hypothetical protein
MMYRAEAWIETVMFRRVVVSFSREARCAINRSGLFAFSAVP